MRTASRTSAQVTVAPPRPQQQPTGRLLLRVAAFGLCLVGCSPSSDASGTSALSAELQESLETSRYVYIASNRKDGSYGKPAEIWFMYHQGAVWVASPPTTWRARRIRAGRPRAKIAVGKVDGPTFTATGSLVVDQTVYDELFRTFARKYPDGWPRYEQRFRSGLADGTRVLIKYQPVK